MKLACCIERSSPLDGDSLDLESGAEEQNPGSDERPGGKLLREVSAVHAVEGIVMRHVGAKDLNRHQVVHRHAHLLERRLHIVEYQACLLGCRCGHLLVCGKTNF